MKIDISAPGKTILFGDHAVVYGKAAIAVSLSLRTRLSLVSPNGDKVVLDLKNLGLRKEWNVNDLINCNIFGSDSGSGSVVPSDESCIKIISEKFNLNSHSESEKLAFISFLYLWIFISRSYNIDDFPSCIITIDSDLSIGSGMGSSASYSVCLSAAILILCGRITPSLLSEDKVLINKWAFQAERIFHGKPSGIDNSICTYGGALLFENGAVCDTLSELQQIRIFLVDTNVSRNTKSLVASVKQKRELYPCVIDSVMEAIHYISKECWQRFKQFGNENEKLASIQELMVMNHHLLNSLGVGHKKLSLIFDVAQRHSCAAKLTGAGGGGCAIVMIPSNNETESVPSKMLKEELESYGFKVWDIYIGHNGVEVTFQNY